MTHMSGRLAAAVVSVALIALACASEPGDGKPSVPFADDVRFAIQDANNQRTDVDGIANLEGVLPFEIVWPQNLPYDMEVRSATVSVPDERMSDVARRLQFSVTSRFANDEASVAFMLEQSLLLQGMTADGADQVSVGDQIGQIARPPAQAPDLISLIWPGCDAGFMISTSTTQLTQDETIRIAESVLDACR